MSTAFCLEGADIGYITGPGLDAGGVTVDNNFVQHIEGQLRASVDIDEEEIAVYLSDGLRDFQQAGKRTFSSATESCNVRIAGRYMNSTDPPIRRGVYRLSGYGIRCALHLQYEDTPHTFIHQL